MARCKPARRSKEFLDRVYSWARDREDWLCGLTNRERLDILRAEFPTAPSSQIASVAHNLRHQRQTTRCKKHQRFGRGAVDWSRVIRKEVGYNLLGWKIACGIWFSRYEVQELEGGDCPHQWIRFEQMWIKPYERMQFANREDVNWPHLTKVEYGRALTRLGYSEETALSKARASGLHGLVYLKDLQEGRA